MWNSVEVSVGAAVVRGRYRLEGEMLVLEWRGGRLAERCGMVKPEVVALHSAARPKPTRLRPRV